MVIAQIVIDMKDITEISCNILRREDATNNEYQVAKIFEDFTNEFIKILEEYAKVKAETTLINEGCSVEPR